VTVFCSIGSSKSAGDGFSDIFVLAARNTIGRSDAGQTNLLTVYPNHPHLSRVQFDLVVAS
jgi:hypothetical protein